MMLIGAITFGAVLEATVEDCGGAGGNVPRVEPWGAGPNWSKRVPS